MYYLYRIAPFDSWRVVTVEPDEGEVIALPDCRWVAEAQAEADRRNGKGNAQQESLPI